MSWKAGVFGPIIRHQKSSQSRRKRRKDATLITSKERRTLNNYKSRWPISDLKTKFLHSSQCLWKAGLNRNPRYHFLQIEVAKHQSVRLQAQIFSVQIRIKKQRSRARFLRTVRTHGADCLKIIEIPTSISALKLKRPWMRQVSQLK